MVNRSTKSIREFQARNRQVWRKWLEENHAKAKNVRLVVYHKHSRLTGIRYDEAVEEALCFGWIDGGANRRDDESFLVLFARRNPASIWSQSNRQRVEKLLRQGSMTRAGLEMVELAKRTGTWTALDPIEEMVIPDDLQATFGKEPAAFRNFQSSPPSTKRMILAWIATAKRPETRQKRIEQAVKLAAKDVKIGQTRQ